MDVAMVASVQVGVPALLGEGERRVRSAIVKHAVHGPVAVLADRLDGDRQADRRVHGGPDKAVYAYATEDYEWWTATLGCTPPLAAGTFGENLTTVGIDLREASVGDRWRVGTAVFEVAQPRSPCSKLGVRMGDPGFADRFDEAGRPGAYLRVVVIGVLTAGDRITVEAAEPPAVTIAEVFASPHDADAARRVQGDPRVPPGWRRRAARRVR